MQRNRSLAYWTLTVLFVITGDALALAVDENFASLVKRTQGEKPKFAERQQDLLKARYDLADRPAKDSKMSRGKPVQDGANLGVFGKLDPEQAAKRSLRGRKFFFGIG